jgi:hypothetical protein
MKRTATPTETPCRDEAEQDLAAELERQVDDARIVPDEGELHDHEHDQQVRACSRVVLAAHPETEE